MDEKPNKSLEERVARLEELVDQLRRSQPAEPPPASEHTPWVESPAQSSSLSSAISTEPKAPVSPGFHTPRQREHETAGPGSSARPFPTAVPRHREEQFSSDSGSPAGTEFWLNKIGIALLLFGVAFLFKYSIDQGWLTPAVRVGFGLLLGTTLTGLGLRIAESRPHFSQVVLGGGIATYYITGFAAFQILELISHPVAFGFMVAVTLVSFGLALKTAGAGLALIGTIGGLGTPFLLYTGSGNLPGLVAYTCLVLFGAGAVFYFLGWRSLLWTAFTGGWAVLLLAIVDGLPEISSGPLADQAALQGGIVFTWLLFWLMPLARRLGRGTDPAGDELLPGEGGGDLHIKFLAVVLPLLALSFSSAVWDLEEQTWGWIALAGAALQGSSSRLLAGIARGRSFSYAHGLAGGVLATLALFLLLEGDWLLLALGSEAFALHLLARRTLDGGIATGAYGLSILAGCWLLGRLLGTQAEEPLLINPAALTDLALIVLAVLVSRMGFESFALPLYRLAAHLAWLAWLYRELVGLVNGQAYASIAWGVYGVLLLIFALRLHNQALRWTSMGTLLLVVAKLFLVDLAEVDTLWRVLLFLGFGGIFLALSYYLRSLWRLEEERGG